MPESRKFVEKKEKRKKFYKTNIDKILGNTYNNRYSNHCIVDNEQYKLKLELQHNFLKSQQNKFDKEKLKGRNKLFTGVYWLFIW